MRKTVLFILLCLSFIGKHLIAQTTTCPGTGYCETSIHSLGCDFFLGGPSFPIGEVKFAGIDNVQDVACDAIPPTDAHCGAGVANVKAGESYPIMLDVGDNSSPDNLGNFYGVWIDFNQNGVFAPEEFVASNEVETMTPFNATVTIPQTTLTGKTRMRIRSDWYDNQITANEACTNFTYGETEDYEINIAPCPATALITAEGDTVICEGDSVKLTASAGTAYLWNTGDTSKSIYAKALSTYSVMVTNANTCKASDDIFVEVKECTPEGISNLLRDKIALWPNPASDRVSIIYNIPRGMVTSVSILNIHGKLLRTETVHFNDQSEQVIDLSDFPKGIYFIKLDGKDCSVTKKLLRQ